MARRLKFDIPGPDWRVGEEQVRERGWEALFAPHLHPPLRLVVEIGFGRGEFLLWLASENPGTAYVGVEYSRKRTLKVARRLARTSLCNVRLLHARGERVVRELLAPASVEACWINFPDPWPKKRHHRRRLVQSCLVGQLATRLRRDGRLHVATDHVGYAQAIDAALRGEPRLENAYAPESYRRQVSSRRPTAYEIEWRSEGRELFFWEYRRCATAAETTRAECVDTRSADP